MNLTEIRIIKRDGKQENFSAAKITNAIGKAFEATGIPQQREELDLITRQVVSHFSQPTIGVEEIQDLVENELMKVQPEVAKKYIIYRQWRNTERDRKTHIKHIMDGIVAIDKNDVNLSNANMSSHTPAGQMMTFASEITKDYTYKYLLPKKYAEAHQMGDIHIHDLDYYPTKTTTCIQYDLDDLFERGFHTKNGSIRTPQSIQSYATLATIIFQTNQNEQHGGQAIPAFDFFMAKGVLKSFQKIMATHLGLLLDIKGHTTDEKEILKGIRAHFHSIAPNEETEKAYLDSLQAEGIDLTADELKYVLRKTLAQTRKDTHQAMEGFIHNLNTMHSRGGNQVVFSSINYGTDTSAEGRMVIQELLKATIEGLGNHGEVPVFPIQIFKVKDGVSYSEADYQLAMKDFEAALSGDVKFECPNFDLFLQACRTTAKALFPNFMFLDTPFNKHEKWSADDPKRYRYELATMGCRTRVFENRFGPKTSIGRGNLSFSTINIVRLAIECMGITDKEQRIARFFAKLDAMLDITARQLHERMEFQKTAFAKQFPLLMSALWIGCDKLKPNDDISSVINQGTLGIGFIGLAECLVALLGKHHGESEEAQELGLRIVTYMRDRANQFSDQYQHNYSVLATPAEGLSGKFTRVDRKKFGCLPGITDRDYYTNSNHVPVYYKCSARHKAEIEAPYHDLTRGGHIFYVEIDGDATHNPEVIMRVVDMMDRYNIGYGSVNHNRNRCLDCGYENSTVNLEACPKCGSTHIDKLQRITGYLVGTTDRWNQAKLAELNDRVIHEN